MSNKRTEGILPFSIDSDRRRQRRRLSKRYEDPSFRERLSSIRRMIGGGQTLHEIRQNIGLEAIKHDSLWEDLVSSFAQSFLNPANLALEWSIRQQSRYILAADLYNNAKKRDDFDDMIRAIGAMSKIDENAIEIQKTLGLLKPVFDEDTGGEGVSDSDLAEAEGRFNELLEQKILNKLKLQREAESPIAFDLLCGPNAGGEVITVGQSPLDENDPKG